MTSSAERGKYFGVEKKTWAVAALFGTAILMARYNAVVALAAFGGGLLLLGKKKN